MSNPSEIFLAPACSADAYGDEGRLWCEDDAWEDYVCECGKGCKSVRYVLDEHVDYGVQPNEITRENVVARRRKAPPRGMGVKEFMSELERTHPELVDEVAYREKLRKGKE